MEPLTMTDTLAAAPDDDVHSLPPGDPAQAFDALRAEVAELRQQMAAGNARSQGVVEQLKTLTASQTDLAKSPALALTPAQYEREIMAAMAEPLRRATQSVEKKARDQNVADRDQYQKAANDQVAAVRSKARWVCGGALVAGFILYPLVSAFMPGGTRLATWATGHLNGWDAGTSLLWNNNPDRWNKLALDSREIERQEIAVRACKDADLFGSNSNSAKCVVTLPNPVKPR
jgi:hypothetical protein